MLLYFCNRLYSSEPRWFSPCRDSYLDLVMQRLHTLASLVYVESAWAHVGISYRLLISWVHMTHRFLSSRLMSVPCQMMSRILSRCCWRSLRALKGCRFLKPLRGMHRNEVHLSTLWRSELHRATNNTCLIFLCYFYSSVSDSVKANSRRHVSLPTWASIGKHSQTDCHIRTIMTIFCFAPCPVEDKHSAWENTVLIFHSLEPSTPAIQTHWE